MGARVYYTERYSARPAGGGGRFTCDRCGGRARFAGYGRGLLCASCRSLSAKASRAAVVELAGGYGLESHEVVDQLADESGVIKTRAPSPPPALLRWAPSPGEAAEYVAGLGGRAAGLQLALVARVLWGVSLWDGCKLGAFPRDHYPADCVEWGLVQWAYDSPHSRRWLTVYGFALRARYAEQHGRDHAASELIVWLCCHSYPDRSRWGAFAPPPSYRACGGEE